MDSRHAEESNAEPNRLNRGQNVKSRESKTKDNVISSGKASVARDRNVKVNDFLVSAMELGSEATLLGLSSTMECNSTNRMVDECSDSNDILGNERRQLAAKELLVVDVKATDDSITNGLKRNKPQNEFTQDLTEISNASVNEISTVSRRLEEILSDVAAIVKTPRVYENDTLQAAAMKKEIFKETHDGVVRAMIVNEIQMLRKSVNDGPSSENLVEISEIPTVTSMETYDPTSEKSSGRSDLFCNVSDLVSNAHCEAITDGHSQPVEMKRSEDREVAVSVNANESNTTQLSFQYMRSSVLVPYQVNESSDSDQSDSEDSETDSSSSRSSDSEESELNSSALSDIEDSELLKKKAFDLKFKKKFDIKTKGEFDLDDLPPIGNLSISADETEMKLLGYIHAIVDKLVIVDSIKSIAALNLDTVLFSEDGLALGQIFDVFGPVIKPFYSIRFNNSNEIEKKMIKIGNKVFYVPSRNEWTSFVCVSQLSENKGSDASWEFNNEPPERFLEFSDDEEERKTKNRKKIKARRGKRNPEHSESSFQKPCGTSANIHPSRMQTHTPANGQEIPFYAATNYTQPPRRSFNYISHQRPFRPLGNNGQQHPQYYACEVNQQYQTGYQGPYQRLSGFSQEARGSPRLQNNLEWQNFYAPSHSLQYFGHSSQSNEFGGPPRYPPPLFNPQFAFNYSLPPPPPPV